jgi:Arc/MetJ-type ribon-helix-helix transcriptional regulator
MTIHLPPDVERDILAQVHAGHFVSVDDALAKSWRSFQQQRPIGQPSPKATAMGSIGAMHDDAELLEQITQGIMHSRETRTLRLPPDE